MHTIHLPSHSERGQSLVELALVFTILVLLVAGVIDLGRAFFTYTALRDAAQEGATYGAIDPTNTSGIQERAWDNLENVVSNPESDVDVSVTIIGGACLGNIIQVDVDYTQFPITMPFLGTIIGSQTFPIHATVQDTILTPTCGG